MFTLKQVDEALKAQGLQTEFVPHPDAIPGKGWLVVETTTGELGHVGARDNDMADAVFTLEIFGAEGDGWFEVSTPGEVARLFADAAKVVAG